MKRFLTTLAMGAMLATPAAFATSYKFDNSSNSQSFYIDRATTYNWNLSGLTLNVNDANNTAGLSGIMTRAGSSATYTLDICFTDPYTSGSTQKWGDFSGFIRNNNTGAREAIRDLQGGRGHSDAGFGLNQASHSSGNSKFEFGFWAYNAGSNRHNFNVSGSCQSHNSGGASHATSPCGGGNGGNGNTNSGSGQVPLPGTLALIGLAALGMGARRIKLS